MNDVVRDIFDRAAESYEKYGRSPLTERVLTAVLTTLGHRLGPGATILDVGAGPGTSAIPLARAGYRVTANDLAPKMLEVLERASVAAGLSIRTIVGDVRALEATERHDAAISIHGPLNYHPRPREVVEAITRHVRPNGLLVFAFSRGAALEQIPRNPRRALVPLMRGSVRVDARIDGRPFDLFLHDPDALAAALMPAMAIDEITPCGVSLRWPSRFDSILGRAPLLRRLGASTIVVGRARA